MMSIKNSGWATHVIRKSGRPLVEWLCLGRLGVPEFTIGVLKDGALVVDAADGLADLHENRALTFVLPLLNSPIEQVRERLANFQNDSNLNGVKPDDFPLNRLVIHAILSGGYWAERAFRWLSEIEFSRDERIIAINGLVAMENNKVFEQSLRHEARRHRRQMESNQQN